MNIEAFANEVVKEANEPKWVNITVVVGDTVIQVKAYGKWIQRMSFNYGYWLEQEFKTQKTMREFIVEKYNESII